VTTVPPSRTSPAALPSCPKPVVSLTPHSARVRFLSSAGVLLVTVALAKLFSACGSARALDTSDPLFGFALRYLLLLAGMIELIIALVCLFMPRSRFSLAAVAWLATSFVVYRAGLWFMGWHQPCACMGTLTDLLHLSPGVADNIMKVLLVYLLVVSYYFLFVKQISQARPREVIRAGTNTQQS
jgi:hypothetical protein